MKAANVAIAITFTASWNAFASAVACPAPPVVTSEAAICLAQLHTSAAASSTYTMKYRAEEHTDFWSVEYWPEAANVRGGGGKLSIDKASGRVVFVEGYR